MPAGYWLWLGGTTLSLVGNQALAFGLAWSASASGGVLAGLVLTAGLLPRVLLLLVGGAVADRAGVRRVLLTGDGVMLAATLGLVLALQVTAPTAALLLGTAVVVGAVDAFYLPASATLPRRLAPPAALPRAMAARQLAGQLALTCGGPLGGLLVGTAGLTAVALADAASFLLVLVVLLALRLPGAPAGLPDAGTPGLARAALDGLRVVLADRPLRLCLVLLSAAALALLPASALLLPLLGRGRGWTAGQTGALVGAVALGTAMVVVTVLALGTSARPGLAGRRGCCWPPRACPGSPCSCPLPPRSRSGRSSARAPGCSPRTSPR
ncbi:MFS transporter [Geodermatophilus sp. URMC 62]|uniref:MFS transporter n=1 Tax=Geodermatophilus sp. URMC 62 TaxID=3423414 RepID=UPI00406D165F